MAVTGTILPKQYANAITLQEQKKKILSHATSVGNKQKQIEDRKTFSYPILCPLCHLHQRKQIKMKLMLFRIYFNVAGQVHIVKKTASTKRGHLIAQVKNTAVKWSIKPSIFRTKKVSKALRQEIVDWIMKN